MSIPRLGQFDHQPIDERRPPGQTVDRTKKRFVETHAATIKGREGSVKWFVVRGKSWQGLSPAAA